MADNPYALTALSSIPLSTPYPKLPIVTPQMFGAEGNGKKGSTGVANNTTTFTDVNAVFTSADVGKTIIIVPNSFTGNAKFIGTISSINSATSIVLSGNPGWSATSVVYYYGTDDTIAINAANAYAGSNLNNTGPSNSFNNYDITSILSFPAPKIYIMTGQAVIAGTWGTTASGWVGLGGTPTIAFGISSTSTDCISFGAAGSTSGAKLVDIVFDCCYSGRDGLVLDGFQSPQTNNVTVRRTYRDGWVFAPGASSFVQQGCFISTIIQYLGRHGICVNPNSAGFANEINFINLDIAGVSQNQSGGAPIYVENSNGNVDSWNIINYKFTQNWNGNSSYQPLASPVYIPSGNNCFNAVGLTLTSGYFEQSTANPLGANSSPVYIYPGVSAKVRFTGGWYASDWSNSVSHSDFDGCGVFTGLAYNATQAILISPANYNYSGTFVLLINDGTNSSIYRFSAVNINGAAATITTLGESHSPSTVSYTVTSSTSGGVMKLIVTNTGSGTTLSFRYLANSDYSDGAPGYIYA